MKKIFYFAFACALALGGASCSDDSSSEVNEWSAIYVGIERPKLGVSTLTLNINHPTAEVEAKASVPVTVKLSRPATQDISPQRSPWSRTAKRPGPSKPWRL